MDGRFGRLTLDAKNRPRQIAERLRELLLAGELKPGERLPSERTLSADFNVSRSALREAVRMLEAAGILVVHHGRGTFIAKVDVARRIEELFSPAPAATAAPQEIYDLQEIRRLVEPEAAAWAAERIGRAELAALRAVCDEARAILSHDPLDFSRLQGLDNDFHARIFRAAGNAVLRRIMDGLIELLAEGRRHSIRQPGRAPRSWVEHRRILEAIARHDAQAARRAMLAHILSVERSSFPRPNGASSPKPAGSAP